MSSSIFAEAVQCYFNGALRASIILGWVVATDNLLKKLEILGREDGEAKIKWEAISKKRENHESYEEELLNSFGEGGLEIFSRRELEQLKYVKTRRHWSAHASDFKPTPEEARTCLRLIVDTVLSSPIYRGYRYIKQLENDIKDASYLPSKGYETIVREVLLRLRPALYPRVARSLITTAKENSVTSTTIANVERFLKGMLLNLSDSSQLQTTVEELSGIV